MHSPLFQRILLLNGAYQLVRGGDDGIERIRNHEYSNSRPQFKQTWYVLFLIVNTPLFWR
jgi:hypothetical protein